MSSIEADGTEHIRLVLPESRETLAKLRVGVSIVFCGLYLAGLTTFLDSGYFSPAQIWTWIVSFVWLFLPITLIVNVHRFIFNKPVFIRFWLYDTEEEHFLHRLLYTTMSIVALIFWATGVLDLAYYS